MDVGRRQSVVGDAGRTEVFRAIGNMTTRLVSCDDDLKLVEHQDGFSTHAGPSQMELKVRWGHLDTSEGMPAQVDVGSWRMSRTNDAVVLALLAPQHRGVPYASVRMRPDFSTGEVRLHRPVFAAGEPVDPLSYPLDELLTVHRLARIGGCEIHSLGVVDEAGRGYLFAGQSGDGKTTLAKLWAERPGVSILSDDRIILRREAGRTIMCGTPWHGEGRFALAASAPLAGVFILGRGPGNTLQPLTPGDAVALLFARSFVPLYDEEALEKSMAFLARALHGVPCHRFPFVPNPTAVDFLREWAGAA